MPFPVPSTCFSPPIILLDAYRNRESCVMRTIIDKVEADKRVFPTFPNHFMRRLVPVAACESFKWGEDEDADRLPGVRRIREDSEVDAGKRQTISEIEINEWLEKETGLDRVRIMYSTGSDGSFLQEDTRAVNVIFRRSIVLGAVISVFTAAAKNQGKKEKHLAASQAVVKGLLNEHKSSRGVIREALKNTVRFTVFSFMLLHGSQMIAAYRNKSSVWEYMISSMLAFGLSNIGQGMVRCATMSVIGAAIGGVGGLSVCSILSSQGMSQEQKHMERIRHHLQQQNLIQQRQTSVSSAE